MKGLHKVLISILTSATFFVCLFLFFTFVCCDEEKCHSNYENEGLFITNTISNQQVTSFAEDALGHIWIGTFRGLNRYDAHEYHQYFNTEDSTSIPDNQVRQVFKDSKNRLWVATGSGICLYTDKDDFRNIHNESTSPNVVQVLENKEGKILINMVVQLCEYNPNTDRFEVVIPDFDVNRSFANSCHMDNSNNLWSVTPYLIRGFNSSTMELKKTVKTGKLYTHHSFMRDNGELWLAASNTLSIFDTKIGEFIEVPKGIRNHPVLSGAVVTKIFAYSHNSLLINTLKGMFCYNFTNDTVIHQSEGGFPFEVPNFAITTLFTDSQKNLWIGSHTQGFVTRYSSKERFNNDSHLRQQMEKKSITSITIDKQEQLWITTLKDGTWVYDSKNKNIKEIETKHLYPEHPYIPNITSIFVDRNNSIWLMSLHKLVCCTYDGHKLHQKKVYWFPTPISHMTQDKNGTIWAGSTCESLYALREGDDTFQSMQFFSRDYTFIGAMTTLSTGEVLVSSFEYGLLFINPDDWSAREFDMSPYLKRSKFIPTCSYEDSSGDIWIGSVSNGLFKYSPRTHKVEDIKGTSCLDICGVQEDIQGNIWVSTLYGMSKYDRTVNSFTNYYANDGIGGNQFNDKSTCRLSDNTIIFGGTHGLTFFNPVNTFSKRTVPLLFENLKIHNKVIHPAQSECIDKALAYKPDIKLRHFQNSFTISFSALDYSEYERVHYQYMMEGTDRFWIDARNHREAYYSNLPAGKYTFKVRITNNNKSIVETENSIKVIISPAPWLSWWAYSIYALLVGAIICAIYYNYQRIKHNKERVRQAELEKEQERRVNKMNMSFFANISHEFRTPLTMISGPVTQLCNEPGIGGENKQLLYIVQRSVNRMLKLVNQLMDFNKLENDTLRLSVKRTNIISELKRLVDVFCINMNKKGITLNTYGLEDTYITWLDADKIDKITGNLMSNALKFTPHGGKIELAFDVIPYEEAHQQFSLTDKDQSAEYLKISVTNSGEGIAEDKLERIFERYYQLNNQSKGKYNWGTGIGLYYARCLVELHHGYIKAENHPEGGAVFTYILPVSEQMYSEQERQPDNESQEDIFPLQTEEQYNALQPTKESKELTVLVVDDDTEVVHYLNTLLSPHYKVICRFNAESAYITLKEEAPDIILSDVVMPGTDGYQLCRMIKENIELCHIPVILVTAKATVEDQVEGLDTGADAYVTKPFNPTYLLALIKSQLKNREKVRSLLGTTTKTDEIEENMLSPQDNAFMTELYQLMENELSNPELNITRMTEVLKISRTKFYYKVKGLTGENPNTFFKTYKLNRAAQLLTEGKYNVSEIADMVGFSTLSHFSSSFKRQFGVSPSEYQR